MATMAVLRQALKLALSAALPRTFFLTRGPASGGSGGERVRDVALTFDDGPHPDHTPRLLDLLGQLEIKATFFLVGKEAARHRRVVARIAANAHDLGKTCSHEEILGRPPGRDLEEVRRTREIIEDVTGNACHLFRPPRGALSTRSLLHLWGDGETVVLWNVDPRDHLMRSPAEVVPWCERYRPRGGDIVLMHDNRPLSTALVGELVRRGPRDVRFVRVSQLLSRSRGGES
jgi:peptidoglycan/xylan/chitin deacetylase (PgdA/CDA1 family)